MTREPNALDAIASVAMTLAEYGAYLICGIALCVFWVVT